jgi:hypothetical protein
LPLKSSGAPYAKASANTPRLFSGVVEA